MYDNIDALGGKNVVVRLWSQKVTGQGHDRAISGQKDGGIHIDYAPSIYVYSFSVIFVKLCD